MSDKSTSGARASREYALENHQVGEPVTACQSSKGAPPFESVGGPFSPYAHGLTDFQVLEVEHFEGGGRRICWPLDGPEPILEDDVDPLELPDPVASDLSSLRAGNEQSTKSRLRAAWTIGNARCKWEAMTTLTYPVANRPDDYEICKRHRRGFLKRAQRAFPRTHYAWILEFTKAQAAHFHVFWAGNIAEQMKKSEFEIVNRSGFDGGAICETKILRGELDKRIVSWWSNQAGDNSEAFERFQNGGITEFIRSPEGAARYAAKEAAKRCQKHAPFLVSQWWGMSNEVRPVRKRTSYMTVGDYVAIYGPVMYRHIW